MGVVAKLTELSKVKLMVTQTAPKDKGVTSSRASSASPTPPNAADAEALLAALEAAQRRSA